MDDHPPSPPSLPTTSTPSSHPSPTQAPPASHESNPSPYSPPPSQCYSPYLKEESLMFIVDVRGRTPLGGGQMCDRTFPLWETLFSVSSLLSLSSSPFSHLAYPDRLIPYPLLLLHCHPDILFFLFFFVTLLFFQMFEDEHHLEGARCGSAESASLFSIAVASLVISHPLLSNPSHFPISAPLSPRSSPQTSPTAPFTWQR